MIPNPWILLGFVGTFLLSSMGAFFYGEHVKGAELGAKIEHQNAEAATLLDQLDKTAAAKDAQQAESGRNMEAQHAKQLLAVSATADAFRNALNERLREPTGGKGSGGSVPLTTAQAGKSESTTSGSDDGRRAVDPVAVSQVRDAMKNLQEDVNFCWTYVGTITR